MPGSRKGFKELNARQSQNFLEFLKIPFSNRLKVSDPTFYFTFILIRMVGLWLRWKPCAGNTCAERDLCTALGTAKLTATADDSELKEVSGMAKLRVSFLGLNLSFSRQLNYGNKKINC